MFRIEAVYLHLVESVLDASVGGLRDVEGTTELSISKRRKGRSLATSIITIITGGNVPALPTALHQVGIDDLICNIRAIAGIEDGSIHFTAAWVSIIDYRPIAFVPSNLVKKHEATIAVVILVVAMIEEPGLSLIVGDNLTVMTRAFPAVIAGDNRGIVVAYHLSALLVDVWAHKFLGAPDNSMIGTLLTLAAGTDAAEQVVVLAALVYHGPLEGTASQLRYTRMAFP